MKIYYEKDVNMDVLKDKTIAVIGYGSQGMAQSRNMAESGLDIIVGLRKDGDSWETAIEHDMPVMTVEEASKEADVIHILIPDEIQAQVYEKSIKPGINQGNAISFSHGYNIHFQYIKPPKNVDIIMIAPKGPGSTVRQQYLDGFGVPGLVAVQQDYTGNALQFALAMGQGSGLTRAGVLETTFKEETETDLFGEQCVLCGGASELVKAGFETLVNAGYQPEIAYFECLHELKLIVDLFYQGGLNYMRYSVSDTAEYGDYVSGPRIVTDETKKTMEKILKEIQDGTFANNWIAENKNGRPFFNKVRDEQKNHQIEKVGSDLRKMMKWIDAK